MEIPYPMHIDWDALQHHLYSRFCLGDDSIHGPEHWQRVERYGLHVAEHNGGDILVVRLFALFHDVCRQCDGIDNEHGTRGAELAALLRGEYFDLPDDSFALFHYACTWHTSGQLSDDPSIGACWDADRLDIWRAGLTPRENFMSTAHARELVRNGKTGPRHVPPGW